MTISQADLESLGNNPTRGINLIINEVENSWNNGQIKLNSKTHPAILCMDLIIATNHGFLNRLSDACSKINLLHARNLEDLSRNLADEERAGLLSNPSTSTLWFIADVTNLKEIATDASEQDNQVTNTYKKVLIPKDTQITVTGYDFLIENGIEIRYNERTGWQVMYDSTTNNPFNTISANLLEREFKVSNGRNYLMVKVPVRQLTCTPSEKINSTPSSGCTGTYVYSDYLYGVRAFLTDNNSQVRELRVSYDQDTFDPINPTLALKIDTVNNRVQYEIPDVYITNKLGLGTVIIYTYTTKGELVKDLTDIDITKYEVHYQDYRYPGNALNMYSTGLPNSGGIAWQFADVISGGSNPIPFMDLKQALIDGRRLRAIPITDKNLTGEVKNSGYGNVKSVDLLTGRKYSVTKELPVQTNKKLASTMNCYVGSHLTSVQQLIDSGVTYNNGKRVTLPPGVLFDVSSPSSVLVNQITKNAYLAMSSSAKVELISDTTLVYVPFYYVFDLTNDQTVLRIYHLDEPSFLHQNFISENTNLGLEVGVGSINIDHTDAGYVITLVTKSGKGYKELETKDVGIQLSFATQDSVRPACIGGTFLGLDKDKERIWQFKLDSNYDVDVNDILYINNVNQFGQPKDNAGIKLTDTLSFIFAVSADTTVPSTNMDAKLEPTLFSQQMMAVIETHYKVNFGAKLTNIYSRIRPLKGNDQFQIYDHDVVDTYTDTKYQYSNGKLVLDANKKPIAEHQAGDPILDSQGRQVLLYRKGIDFILDGNGNPILKAAADLLYHWDFVGFDGAYFFSNDKFDIAFAQETKDYFVKVITKDLDSFNSDALDRTSLQYQPKSKVGYRNVLMNNNAETILRQDLNFMVSYYLTNSGYNNSNLKDSLRDTTPQILNTLLLGSSTLGMSDITKVLRDNAGPEVVDVKLSAFAGNTTLDVVSNLDDTSGFSVRKLLEAGSDGLVSVVEAVDVTFLEHDIRTNKQ